MEKHVVVGDGFFYQRPEHHDFRAIHDGMDAVLKSLHGIKRLIIVTQQNDRRVAAASHRHGLQGFQGKVFLRLIGGKQFIHDHDLIRDLAEARREFVVRDDVVDFVTDLLQRFLGGVDPCRTRAGNQGRAVCGADEIKGFSHII